MNLFLLVARKMLQMRSGVLVFVTIMHFFLFWLALGLTEARDARILAPADYWYYWWTTVLTIGYGDLSPQSIGGRVIAPFFEFSGILLLAAWLGKAGNTLAAYESKKRRGLMPTHANNHILIIGDYDPVNIRNLLLNAVNDAKDDGHVPSVVGCFRNTGEQNPFQGAFELGPARLEYVQAPASGFTKQTLMDAGVERARHIYVCASDDTSAIGIICLLSQFHLATPIALILQKEESAALVPRAGLNLVIIRPVTAALAVREMEDPGTAAAIEELLSAGVGRSLYSFPIALRVPYAHAVEKLRSLSAQAVTLGYSRKNDTGAWTPVLAPAIDASLEPGDRLLYIASRDLGATEERSFTAMLFA